MPQYESFSDRELFLLGQKGDTRAFETIYNRYWFYLTRLANRRLDSLAKAEDMVQDIFLSLFKRIHQIELEVSLKAYLLRALNYRIINEFRAEQVRKKYAESAFFYQDCKNDFASRIDARNMELRIHSAVRSLPVKCKQVYTMSREENKNHREIASQLQLSVSTVEKHIGKALKILRGSLVQYGLSG